MSPLRVPARPLEAVTGPSRASALLEAAFGPRSPLQAVAHLWDDVRELADGVLGLDVIHAGEVLFEGAPEEILADPEVRRVYLGDRFS